MTTAATETIEADEALPDGGGETKLHPTDTVLCSCGGFAGTVRAVSGHRSRSTSPECRGEWTPISAAEAERLRVAIERAKRAGSARAEARGPRGESMQTTDIPSPAPVPRTRTTAAERPGTLPEPTTTTVTLHLASSTIALYDASRTNPELAFDGTMSQWVDEIAHAFYESIGMTVDLVRRVPVYATPTHLEATA